MTRLFRIAETGLVESRRKPLYRESRIEDWVACDLSLCGVDVRRTYPRNEARTCRGIFANQAIACKIYDQQTADFLRGQFGLAANEATA